MLRVSCADIGVEGCDFVAAGEKVHKVENTMLEHIRDEHPHMIAGLSDVQFKELETRIKSGMHAPEAGALSHEVDRHVVLYASCADLGVQGCDFVATDKKVRKVEERMFDHIREKHPDLVVGLTYEEHSELEHRVKAAIQRE